MLVTLATVAGLALTQQLDTTITVRPGARLEVNNYGGVIVVRAWTQDRVRVTASHSSRTQVRVSASESEVSVHAEGHRGTPQLTDFEISVPRSMALRLSGTYTHIEVDGVDGAVSAETVEGDVTLRGGNGTATLKSVEGDVMVTGARGRVDAASLEGVVHIAQATGEIVAETVDGDIFLEGIDSPSVEANTTDGDIYYDGTIKDNGRYRLVTHDGDVTVGIPERVNATVSVVIFDGDFESSFPVQITQSQRRGRFQFTLGSGGARVELETFDGDVELLRPNQIRLRIRDELRDHREES